MIYTLPDGRQVDLTSGTGVSGQVEAEKATPREARQERPEEIYPEGKLSFRTAMTPLSELLVRLPVYRRKKYFNFKIYIRMFPGKLLPKIE